MEDNRSMLEKAKDTMTSAAQATKNTILGATGRDRKPSLEQEKLSYSKQRANAAIRATGTGIEARRRQSSSTSEPQ